MANTEHVTEYAALRRHREEMAQARRRRRWRVGLGLAGIALVTVGAYWLHPALGFMLAGIGAMVLFFAAITGGSSVPADQMSGTEGESRTLEALKRLPEEFTIFNQVRIPDPSLPNGNRELDFIVVGPNGISVVEVKNTPGLIYVDPDTRHWQVVKRAGCGSRPGWNAMDNPLGQVRAQIDALDRWLIRYGLNPPIRPAVCFARPDSALEGTERTDIPVVLTDDLNDSITTPGGGALDPATRSRIERLLVGSRDQGARRAA